MVDVRRDDDGVALGEVYDIGARFDSASSGCDEQDLLDVVAVPQDVFAGVEFVSPDGHGGGANGAVDEALQEGKGVGPPLWWTITIADDLHEEAFPRPGMS
ncbi:hypothetical protein [Streptomyces malaysiensis]|uniref:hypothetical protein n=1 Tax=Streptomyces malaysiensis TaxID=92644 RepID=UPI002B27E9D4|nr:hypothetical protein R8789_02440 [Streptomyces malaysiensis]